MPFEPVPAYSAVRGSAHVGRPYNESAFRHFLAADRRRAARATRTLLLVLVGIRETHGRCRRLSEVSAAALFDALAATTREVDVIGWYREDYVAAAALPQATRPDAAIRVLIRDRLLAALYTRLPYDEVPHLRVRILGLGSAHD